MPSGVRGESDVVRQVVSVSFRNQSTLSTLKGFGCLNNNVFVKLSLNNMQRWKQQESVVTSRSVPWHFVLSQLFA
jgi:hypothetical protein